MSLGNNLRIHSKKKKLFSFLIRIIIIIIIQAFVERKYSKYHKCAETAPQKKPLVNVAPPALPLPVRLYRNDG